MSVFNGAVKVDMPLAAGIVNGIVGAVTVDMPVAAGTLVQASIFNGAVKVDMPESAAVVINPRVFNGAVTVDFPSVAGVIVNPGVFNGAVTVDMPRVAALLGYGFNGAVTVNMPVAAGTIGSATYFNGAVTVDMPLSAGTIGFQIPGTNTVLVMNLKNKVVSVYENFNFNSACKLNGVYLGAASDGIHILSGADDKGTKIDASITMGDSDFGLPNVKMIPELFLTLSGGEMEVYVSRDQEAEMGDAENDVRGPYPVPAPVEGKTQTKRAKLPQGFQGGHWQFKVANVDGGDFNLQSIEIPVEKSNRRLN